MCGSLTWKVALLYGTQRVLGVKNAQTSYVTMDVMISVPWFLRGVMCFVSSNKLRRPLAPENIVSSGKTRLPYERSTLKWTRHSSVGCEDYADVWVTRVTLIWLCLCHANLVTQLSSSKAIETLEQFRRKYKYFGTVSKYFNYEVARLQKNHCSQKNRVIINLKEILHWRRKKLKELYLFVLTRSIYYWLVYKKYFLSCIRGSISSKTWSWYKTVYKDKEKRRKIEVKDWAAFYINFNFIAHSFVVHKFSSTLQISVTKRLFISCCDLTLHSALCVTSFEKDMEKWDLFVWIVLFLPLIKVIVYATVLTGSW